MRTWVCALLTSARCGYSRDFLFGCLERILRIVFALQQRLLSEEYRLWACEESIGGKKLSALVDRFCCRVAASSTFDLQPSTHVKRSLRSREPGIGNRVENVAGHRMQARAVKAEDAPTRPTKLMSQRIHSHEERKLDKSQCGLPVMHTMLDKPSE